MTELYQQAAMTRDLPTQGLHRGEVVLVVEKLTALGGKKGCCIEVLNALGECLRVEVVDEQDLEPLRADEFLCVRPLTAVAA